MTGMMRSDRVTHDAPRIAGWGWVFAACFLVGCQKGEMVDADAATISPLSAPSATPAAPPPSSGPPPAGSAAPDRSAGTDTADAAATADNAEIGDAGIGDWTDTMMYKFRLQEVKRCEAAALAADAQAGPILLGVKMQVSAKIDQIMASARDVTLEGGGVVFRSSLTIPAGSKCMPPLGPKQLRHNETATGFAAFELPADTNLRVLTIAFQPTRWGGAPRVQIALPDSTRPGNPPAKKAK
jgi:hypothetical protein